MIGFGLDLAGYATNKTSLATIEANGEAADVTILRQSCFSGQRETASPIPIGEAEELLKCIKVGPIAVDIPIDLQGLPHPEHAEQIWELTKRPIDRELRAMPPFADRIGAPVARFARIMKNEKVFAALGELLFETYPAAAWRELGIYAGAYKSKKEEDSRGACDSICEQLCMEPHIYNDDDIDAIICAITAVAPASCLKADEDYGVRLPVGFRLLKKNPFKHLRVGVKDFSEWLASRSYDAS